MTPKEKFTLKSGLKAFAEAQLNERIRFAEESLSRAQEAANEEGKSAMGDKYEVGRAMGQLDTEMYGHQLEEINRDLIHLHQIDVSFVHDHVSIGSVIITDSQIFFISVGLGMQKAGDRNVVFISLLSPLGQAFAGKRIGDEVGFHGQKYHIVDLF